MTPSFIGRYAIISSGVRPTISLASLPTANILLSVVETATTDGSLRTIPLPGTKTSTVVVPRSMPSLGEKENAMGSHSMSFSEHGQLTKRSTTFCTFPDSVRTPVPQRFALATGRDSWHVLDYTNYDFLPLSYLSGFNRYQNFFEKFCASSQTRFR